MYTAFLPFYLNLVGYKVLEEAGYEEGTHLFYLNLVGYKDDSSSFAISLLYFGFI